MLLIKETYVKVLRAGEFLEENQAIIFSRFAVSGQVTNCGFRSCKSRTQQAEDNDREYQCWWKPMTEDHSEGPNEVCNFWCLETWRTIIGSSLSTFTIQQILNARLPLFRRMRFSYFMTLCRKCTADKSEIRGVAARLLRTADTSDSEVSTIHIISTLSHTAPLTFIYLYGTQAMKFGTSLVLSLLTTTQVVLSQWKCDSQVYGRPVLEHCAKVLTSMPDASAKSPTTRLAAMRKFVEPQYLEPPFSRCRNERDAPMEQLPKLWRYSQSERLRIT